MKDLYKQHLFRSGCFVEDAGEAGHAYEAVIALAELFGIEIESGSERAGLSMIKLAASELGKNVPKPFYVNFPDSVREMSFAELFTDQMYNYFRTYGLGEFDEPRHSIYETPAMRKVFSEKTEVRKYSIITEAEAVEKLMKTADNLASSSRPLSEAHYALLLGMVNDYGYKVRSCPCKDTVINLLIDTHDSELASMIKLSDVIRLAEYLQYRTNQEKNWHLNLRNKDRKLIRDVLDRIFEDGNVNVVDCYEKKKKWAGLLHHIHYKPVNQAARDFLAGMRGRRNYSVYSEFEAAMAEGNIPKAVDIMTEKKGGAALLRSLIYILRRCRTDEDVDYVIGHIDSKNKIVMLQLLQMLSTYTPYELRSFTFTRFNMLCMHAEEPYKVTTRPVIAPEVIARAKARIRQLLEDACRGRLGKVYVDPAMKKTALPIQENASMSGAGILPKGSRLPLPADKKLRVFIYWEKVDDIDLSGHAMWPDGRHMEFSWRNTGNIAKAILFSGDQTAGFTGGSEYFDVDIAMFREMYPEADYLFFCSDVYSRQPYSSCYCMAGYMLRDHLDSGEVFEPKTVRSSFRVTSNSTLAYLFAIDLKSNEFVWLNLARFTNLAIAGEDDQRFIRKYLNLTDHMNVYDYAVMLASEVTDDPAKADVVFSDSVLPLKDGAEQIRSIDTDKMIALLN